MTPIQESASPKSLARIFLLPLVLAPKTSCGRGPIFARFAHVRAYIEGLCSLKIEYASPAHLEDRSPWLPLRARELEFFA